MENQSVPSVPSFQQIWIAGANSPHFLQGHFNVVPVPPEAKAHIPEAMGEVRFLSAVGAITMTHDVSKTVPVRVRHEDVVIPASPVETERYAVIDFIQSEFNLMSGAFVKSFD